MKLNLGFPFNCNAFSNDWDPSPLSQSVQLAEIEHKTAP